MILLHHLGIVYNEPAQHLRLCKVLLHVRLLGAQYADGQARTRERVSLHQTGWQIKLKSQLANLVLVEVLQRLHHLAFRTKLANLEK